MTCCFYLQPKTQTALRILQTSGFEKTHSASHDGFAHHESQHRVQKVETIVMGEKQRLEGQRGSINIITITITIISCILLL